MGVFPDVHQNPTNYMRFIGTQATRGNFLARDPNVKKINGEHPFKGEDVQKFINNIQ